MFVTICLKLCSQTDVYFHPHPGDCSSHPCTARTVPSDPGRRRVTPFEIPSVLSSYYLLYTIIYIHHIYTIYTLYTIYIHTIIYYIIYTIHILSLNYILYTISLVLSFQIVNLSINSYSFLNLQFAICASSRFRGCPGISLGGGNGKA